MPLRVDTYSLACLYRGYTAWPALFGLFGIVKALCAGLPVLPALLFTGGGLLFYAVAPRLPNPLPSRPRWTEFGERFRYRNLYGIHSHEWQEVRALRFSLERFPEPQPDDADDLGPLVTRLRISLARGRVVTQTISCGACAWEYAEAIILSLSELLQDDLPEIRQAAVTALSVIRPEVGLTEELRESEKGLVEKDARGVAEVLRLHALPALVGAARDPNPDVREAAAGALAVLRESLGVHGVTGV